MLEILGNIWWLLVALAVLVTFHEFGHFWVARRCGVKVLRFSVGFGRPLWSRRGRDGTEYVIAAIPLGGYVKMLDEREQPVDPALRKQAFNTKSLGQRTAIVAAGPVFNLIFAVAAFWLMFVVGIPETRPVLGPTSGVAAEAGLREEDLIVAVGDRSVQSWTHALLALLPAALDRRPVVVTVETADGQRREHRLALDGLQQFREEDALNHLGMMPWQPPFPPEIGEVDAGSPAAAAGLARGDRLLSIDGAAVTDWREIGPLVAAGAGAQRPLDVTLERAGRIMHVTLSPDTSGDRPVIGIRPPPLDEAGQARLERNFTVLRHGPMAAVPRAFGETWRLTTGTLGILGRMLTGKASLQNLSGPITIAQMAHVSARQGVSRFLWFLGLISLSLAIINLLPIPMLDGGHLMYYLMELFKGSPVSERTQIAGQYLGLLVIVGLMSLAIFNDILRLVS